MGAIGADIHAVEIVEKRGGHAIDDFMVDLPAETPPDSLVTVCTGVRDVQVLWLSRYSESWSLNADIDVLDDMTADPANASTILTQAAPDVFHVSWAVLVDRATNTVLQASDLAPDLDADALAAFSPLDEAATRALPADWLPGLTDMLVAIAPLRDGTAIVLGRHGGPEFMPSEVARLRLLASLAG